MRKAHAEFFLERLEVNVTRAMVIGVEEKHRNHLDNRRVSGGRLLIAYFGSQHHVARAIGSAFRLRSIKVGDRFLDRVGRRANVFDVAIQDEGKRVRGFHVHRVSDRDHERAVAHGARDGAVSLGDFDIERLEDIRRRGDGGQVDKFHAVLRSERSHDILLSNEALIDQLPDDTSGACFDPRVLDLVLREKSNLPEYFDDKFFVMSHACFGGHRSRLRKSFTGSMATFVCDLSWCDSS